MADLNHLLREFARGLPLELLMSPVLLGLVGLAIGSFLNVVAHRLPLMLERQWWRDVANQLGDAASWERVFQLPGPAAVAAAPVSQAQVAGELARSLDQLPPLGIARPRSRCPSCGHAIRWHENVPVLGWLRLGGRCASCKARISIRYPAVELATGVVFAWIGWRFAGQPAAAMWCAVAATLIALALIDWDTTLLPDALTLPLLWAGLVAAALGWSPLTLPAALGGAAAGYLSLWSVYWLFKLTTGKEGMGYGDFKLLAALGAWLGASMIVPILLMASVIGAAVGIAMKMRAALREGRYVPFGPFLAGAGMVVLLAGPPRVLSWIGWA